VEGAYYGFYFLAFYDQNGRLPVWNFFASETDMMIGYHSVPVIVDAYMKGIGDFNAEHALEACIATANMDDYRGIGLYKSYGYIPYDKEGESVSKTLEYAFDDYCISLMAEKMGKKEIAETFRKRSENYRNLYNPESGFMQPRDEKGNFINGFDAKEYTTHITESNGWQ
jgi:putative alpha-1,2-mannosidase